MAKYKYQCNGCQASVYFDEAIDTERFFCPDVQCGDISLVMVGYSEGDSVELVELHQKIELLQQRVDAIWEEYTGEPSGRVIS